MLVRSHGSAAATPEHDVRIAIDARAYFQRTGIARYTRGLIGALATWAPKDEFLVLISDHHQADELPLPAHMTVQVSLAPWLAGDDEADRLGREAETWGADLFHAVFPPLAVATVPTVTTVFDVTPFTHPEAHQRGVREAFASAWQRSRRQHARLVAVSQATRDALLAWNPADRDPAVIGIGLSAPFDAPLPADADASFRNGVLFVGTLEPRKNLGVAVDAVSRLAQDGTDVRLTIVGKPGWGDEAGRTLADMPGVDLRGFVPDDDLLALYRQAAILVCPSRDEGFGLPVLEAMAQGVLPLVSPAPALTELVDTPHLVVECRGEAFAAAIRWWLDRPAERADVTARLQVRAREHSWQHVANQWVERYQSLLA